MDWQKIEILDKEPILNKRLVSEMLHIGIQKSPLNTNKDTEKLHDSYNSIISRIRRHSFS